MKKANKAICALLAAGVALAAGGCQNQSPAGGDSMFENGSASISSAFDNYPSGTNLDTVRMGEIIKIASDKPYSSLIKTRYPEKELIHSFYYKRTDGNFVTTMSDIDAKYPIECLRERENAPRYNIYQTKEEGLLYVFYTPESPYDPETTFYFVDMILYAKKVLYQKDFAKLKAGDPLSKVEAIDAGTKAINSVDTSYLAYPVVQNYETGRQEHPPHTTYHLLKDGLCEIIYDGEGDDTSTYTVKEVKFYSLDEVKALKKNNYWILEQDYIG